MLKQSRSTGWRNRLIWVAIIVVLISASVSVIFSRTSDRVTLNAQSPISIASYFRDCAFLFIPIRIDNKPYKIKGNGNYTARVTLSENKKMAYVWLARQSPFARSHDRIFTCFANTEATSQSWLTYACRLLDLPPPLPPPDFA